MEQNNALPSTIVFQDAQQGMQAFNTANLVFSPVAMSQIQELSTLMANTSGIVPRHFNNNPGACFSIIMQAGRWGMDPFSLAQHTFDISGKLGFEAKVIQSVLQSAGGIKFKSKYSGDWSKVRGKTVERESRPKGPNDKPKKFRVPNWTANDEIGLNLTLTGVWPDGREETMVVEMNSCHPRQSTNWAHDPEQQVWYSAIKKFGRRYAPELLLGVSDRDDLAARNDTKPMEKEINPVEKHVEPERSTLDDVMQETQSTQETSSGLDDIMTENFVPDSRFKELQDILTGVNTKEDYRQAAPLVTHAFKNGELTQDEHETLLDICKTLYIALNEE